MCSTLLLQRQETATTASASTAAHTIGRRREIDDELFHHRPAANTSHCFIDSTSPPEPPPRNLPNVVLRINLRVAFRTLRELLLDSNKSQFRIDDILKHELHYKNISISEWDHHNDAIGRINNHNPLHHHHHHLIKYDHLQQKQYIGAIRQTNYQMPKTTLVEASMAYETAVITEYNDDCFAIRLTTFTPTVPFGDRFVSITQIVVKKTVVAEGGEEEDSDESDICEMVVSVDVQYPKGKPMSLISNRIKNGVIQGAKDVYEKTSAVILSRVFVSER